MSKLLFANGAKSTLASGITDVATALTVQAGIGALFPSPSAGDWFLATLVDISGNFEIVKVTARSVDTFTTIVRAQEGTAAIAFASGSKCELRATKGTMERIPQTAGGTLNRIPYYDASLNLVDDANLTYDGTTFKIGSTKFTVAQASGNTVIAGTLALGTGAAVGGATPGAGGIAFPAIAVAVANVNTLDDYEEGSFTPGISFGGGTTGITYAVQASSYTKIGPRVFFTLQITLTNKGSSTGTALVTGLPFTSANDSANNAPCAVVADSLAAGAVTQIMANVASNDTTISLFRYAAGGISLLDDTMFTNSSILRLSGSYYV